VERKNKQFIENSRETKHNSATHSLVKVFFFLKNQTKLAANYFKHRDAAIRNEIPIEIRQVSFVAGTSFFQKNIQ
jgi:hypothetical protein